MGALKPDQQNECPPLAGPISEEKGDDSPLVAPTKLLRQQHND